MKASLLTLGALLFVSISSQAYQDGVYQCGEHTTIRVITVALAPGVSAPYVESKERGYDVIRGLASVRKEEQTGEEELYLSPTVPESSPSTVKEM